MTFAYFYKGNPDSLHPAPADLPCIVIQAPADNVYTDEQMRQIAECDAAYASGAYITEQVFKAAGKLRMVQTAGTGYDKLDIASATKHGVPCCNNADMNSSRVADFAMMLTLAHFRNYVPTTNHLVAGRWEEARKEGIKALEVEDKTMGIIGFGNIGAKLAKRAHAFDMHVLYNDVLKDLNKDVAARTGARFAEKEEIFRKADVISIHTPLDETTRGMVGERQLHMMKRGAFLVLTARGGIVDEQALRNALDSGHLGGAGIDVFTTEPFAQDNPLIGAKNITLSPHVAGRGKEGVVRSFNAAMENIRRVTVRSEAPINVLNPEALKKSAPQR